MEKRKDPSLEEFKLEALKYNRRVDFCNNSNYLYQKACKLGILNEICSHMPIRYCIGRKPHNYKWTFEKLYLEALKYKTRMEFAKKGKKAYDVANKQHILDDLCGHMKKTSGVSLDELELLNIIKTKYKEVKRFRISKIQIANKEHIKGFEIDIYIPELNKGIEFDGSYWHSVDIMKKKKPNWPIEDVVNYHEIKDSFFLDPKV